MFIFDSLTVHSRSQLLQDTCRFVQFISEFKRRHLTSKSNTFFLFSARLSHFQVDQEKKRERAILKDTMFSRQNRVELGNVLKSRFYAVQNGVLYEVKSYQNLLS